MLAVERRIKVLERVAQDQAVEVGALSREFQVSEMTIRRDLRRLERDGFVRRTYGGASTHLTRAFEVGTNARVLRHAPQKRWIAQEATHLTDGVRVMFIGIGSTLEQFARLMPARSDLVVITPSLAIASLLGTRRIRVIIAGGMVRQDELTCVGAAALDGVRRYNTDVAVIGAAGISARRGITELDDREAEVIRAALEQTERIVVLADGSKFGEVTISTVSPIERVATIVTDTSADPAEVEQIRALGVEVVVVAQRGDETAAVHDVTQAATAARA